MAGIFFCLKFFDILDPSDPDFKERYHALRRSNARFRVLGRSWWPEELPNDEEYAEALATLERALLCRKALSALAYGSGIPQGPVL